MAKKKGITQVESYDNDSVWKEILEKFLKEFVEYLFPDAYLQVDCGKGMKGIY
ncbi:MAG: hypothetical protein J0M03_10670 [Acidobacteria bacterium]|nr:hypothetical protein [Acidobacteriota bacterium]